MMVVMERTQALMSRNLESKSLRDPLDGKVAKLLKFKLVHCAHDLGKPPSWSRDLSGCCTR